MGCRLKQNPKRTFICFFEATGPGCKDKDPTLLPLFPDDFKDEESSQALPRFCFPYDVERVRAGIAVQHFTFVLTDLEGCQRFGFCRLTSSTNTCLCVLSYLPWFEVFYKLLNSLADYLLKGEINEMKELLSALYEHPLPMAVGSVGLSNALYFIAPDPRTLPSIPENRNLTELIVAVDVVNLLQLYASMLLERRILIFASKLSTLTACVHAISAVLYPMYWQHIFIPVLPPHLLDYCSAPMPFLIGVHSSLSERVRGGGLEDVVILNVDSNTLETPFDDLKRIPTHVVTGLKVSLKSQAVSPGCGVSRAFLKAQALLFGGYRDALQSRQSGEMCFREALFLEHKSASMKQFLQSAVHLQFFKQFIDSRLEILNKGKDVDDFFEDEITKCETSPGGGKSYQQLVGHLKKGGGALILNMKTKANMRAKGLSKSSLKNLLIHKTQQDQKLLHRGSSVSHHCTQSDSLQSRLPITQHYGKSRPRRPAHLKNEQNQDRHVSTWDGGVSGPGPCVQKEDDGEEQQQDEAVLCDPEEMDLLGEIFDTLSSRSSHERGLLYGTRSLDLFGPDSNDFITKRGEANPSQESLSTWASSSGSWSLDAAEERSDPSQDCDWPDSCAGSEDGALDEDDASIEVTVREEKEEEMSTASEKSKQEVELRDDHTEEEELLEDSVGDLNSERGNGRLENTLIDEEKVEEPRGHHTDTTNHETQQSSCSEGGNLKEENQEQIPPPLPTVISARERFQSPPSKPNFQLRPMSKALAEVLVGGRADTGVVPSEEEPEPPLKVSELKKRFEA